MPGPRVLVVEDERNAAKEIENNLQKLSYNVVGLISSGEIAVAAVEERRPDIVLMNAHLRGRMDGFTAADAIRGMHDVPVVFLAAFSDDATLHRAAASQPFGYLIEPSHPKKLQAAIEIALARHRADRGVRASERMLASALFSMQGALIATDRSGLVTYMNPAARRLSGWSGEEGQKPVGEVCRLIAQGGGCPVFDAVEAVLRARAPVTQNALLVRKDGSAIPVEENAAPLLDGYGKITGVVIMLREIAAPPPPDQLRRSDSGSPRGGIPRAPVGCGYVGAPSDHLAICSSCKRIRDVEGAWNPVEVFIVEHTDAQLTHGICPECARKLYPEVFENRP